MYGKLEPDPVTAPLIVQAYEMRAARASIKDIRAFLAENGVKRSYHGVQHMLRSRCYLGEINFGDFEPNLEAHPAIIDRDLWDAVQRISLPRGRRAKSTRILARLGVLRCGTCGGRMIVGAQTQNGRRYPFYRCSPVGDCPRRVTISAEMVEAKIIDVVKAELADVEGRASAEVNAREAQESFERAQAELDAAVRTFSVLGDEAAAKDRLLELRAARDEARDQADHLGGASMVVRIADDWDRLLLDEQRRFIQLIVARAVVRPGRGLDRLTVELCNEEAAGD